jgi:hypothetical protein
LRSTVGRGATADSSFGKEWMARAAQQSNWLIVRTHCNACEDAVEFCHHPLSRYPCFVASLGAFLPIFTPSLKLPCEELPEALMHHIPVAATRRTSPLCAAAQRECWTLRLRWNHHPASSRRCESLAVAPQHPSRSAPVSSCRPQ